MLTSFQPHRVILWWQLPYLLWKIVNTVVFQIYWLLLKVWDLWFIKKEEEKKQTTTQPFCFLPKAYRAFSAGTCQGHCLMLWTGLKDIHPWMLFACVWRHQADGNVSPKFTKEKIVSQHILRLKVLFIIHQPFSLLLYFSLWAHFSVFSCGILFLMFWLAETTQVIDRYRSLVTFAFPNFSPAPTTALLDIPVEGNKCRVVRGGGQHSTFWSFLILSRVYPILCRFPEWLWSSQMVSPSILPRRW